MLAVSAEFQVTNRETEPFTFTISFELRSDSGALLERTEQTVPAVAPGRTVTETVRIPSSGSARGDGEHVRISKVRRVPSDEAPAAAGTCPPSGIRVTLGSQNAAMGLRVVDLSLENCGTRAHDINGYPALTLLDEDREPVPDIRIARGSGGVATLDGFDTPPEAVTLQPGQAASASLAWRNTTGNGSPVQVSYVTVTAEPGSPPVTVTPELDLGTTGVLAVSPWHLETGPTDRGGVTPATRP
ncbi:MAG TPA: DUF4232 domain-containing protein [Yinghuangia sp.]|uniref:DUF4232 domain-containing protein n=1 Tax=Yinghuangia sp. YIM S10712 TaxID=3436930 RepID=UPI002BC5AC1E|nr:DUF4232 domain-containing protein [Yinghuangia sp.]